MADERYMGTVRSAVLQEAAAPQQGRARAPPPAPQAAPPPAMTSVAMRSSSLLNRSTSAKATSMMQVSNRS